MDNEINIKFEPPSMRFGGDYDTRVFGGYERRLMDQGVGVVIKIPEEFSYQRDDFEKALEKVKKVKSKSFQDVIQTREVEKEMRIAQLNVTEIVDTMEAKSWEELASDFSIDDQYEFGRKLLSIGTYAKKRLLQDDEVEVFCYKDEENIRYGTISGQHRILALKTLAEMGCEIKLTNLRVTKFKD